MVVSGCGIGKNGLQSTDAFASTYVVDNTSAASHMQINFLCQGYRTDHRTTASAEINHIALLYFVKIRPELTGMPAR